MARRYLAAAATIGIVTCVGSSGPSAHGGITGVTWARDIRPIVEQRCAGCHNSGGVAVPALTDYEQVRNLAARIKNEVLARQMPPWEAAPGFGDFVNDQSLTPYETQLLVAWADGGTPLGTTAAADTGATHQHSPAAGAVPSLLLDPGVDTPVLSRRQRYTLRSNEKEDRWIHGWEFRPGNRGLVRQARVTIEPGGILGVWVPPDGAVFWPDGVAQRLPAGATLTMDVEYRQPTAPALDRSSVALFFGATPAGEVKHLDLRRGSSSMQEGLRVTALRPELERAGESVRIVAHRPDGIAEVLLWIRRFDPAHQMTYRFRDPVTLPKGTRLEVFSFDATAAVQMEYVGP